LPEKLAFILTSIASGGGIKTECVARRLPAVSMAAGEKPTTWKSIFYCTLIS
jgi:hypothetical protein